MVSVRYSRASSSASWINVRRRAVFSQMSSSTLFWIHITFTNAFKHDGSLPLTMWLKFLWYNSLWVQKSIKALFTASLKITSYIGSVPSTWSTYKSNSDNYHRDCSVECLRALHVLLAATVPHSGRRGGQRGILRRFLVLTHFYNPKNSEFPEEMKITRK